MKRSSLETVVLILGIGIIGFALFMLLIAEPTGDSAFYTNIVFSFGFLIYIVYSMMATNSLNKEIRGLNNHVKSLKETIIQKDKSISELEAKNNSLNKDKEKLSKDLQQAQSQISSLEAKIKELESSSPEAEAGA